MLAFGGVHLQSLCQHPQALTRFLGRALASDIPALAQGAVAPQRQRAEGEGAEEDERRGQPHSRGADAVRSHRPLPLLVLLLRMGELAEDILVEGLSDVCAVVAEVVNLQDVDVLHAILLDLRGDPVVHMRLLFVPEDAGAPRGALNDGLVVVLPMRLGLPQPGPSLIGRLLGVAHFVHVRPERPEGRVLVCLVSIATPHPGQCKPAGVVAFHRAAISQQLLGR
mmetsp:Transcript_114086/g.303278  ORF Transcript_114086/g.303278 Transcript_114086/m.303278 type:complete len:224 (-) Transcript_114086:839-1510(-)